MARLIVELFLITFLIFQTTTQIAMAARDVNGAAKAGAPSRGVDSQKRCIAKIARDYGLKASFSGLDLFSGLKKKTIRPVGHVSKITLENQEGTDRVDLDWSPNTKNFKVTSKSGARRYADSVTSENEIKKIYNDMRVVFRQAQFELAKAGTSTAQVRVTDNGKKITRVVAPKFSCEFLDFLGCSCLR